MESDEQAVRQYRYVSAPSRIIMDSKVQHVIALSNLPLAWRGEYAEQHSAMQRFCG